jgi:hypothetical protein
VMLLTFSGSVIGCSEWVRQHLYSLTWWQTMGSVEFHSIGEGVRVEVLPGFAGG